MNRSQKSILFTLGAAGAILCAVTLPRTVPSTHVQSVPKLDAASHTSISQAAYAISGTDADVDKGERLVSNQAMLQSMQASKSDTKPGEKSSKPAAVLSHKEIQPGETLAIVLTDIQNLQNVSVKSGFQYPVRFTALDEHTAIGFLPVSYFTLAGDYTVSVLTDELVKGGQIFNITVNEKQFDVQQLTVDESMADSTIFNDEASKEYREKIWPMKEKYDNSKYFDGRLIRPVEGGGITTEFGMVRYVNGKPNPRHDGVDIDVGTGTPIKAAQNGRVLFADFVKLTGNTVIIEHGCGLKTWYQHMDTINVKADDQVKTGDVIGTVGATGFVTGPHLHFSASINNIYINPFTLIETDFLDTLQ